MSADRPSQAGELVALATSWYRFGQGMDGEPFAVALAGPGIARMLRELDAAATARPAPARRRSRAAIVRV